MSPVSAFVLSRRDFEVALADSRSLWCSETGERSLTPYFFAAKELAEKLNGLGVEAGEQENPYFVGVVVA